jgi:hypothetical protein
MGHFDPQGLKVIAFEIDGVPNLIHGAKLDVIFRQCDAYAFSGRPAHALR